MEIVVCVESGRFGSIDATVEFLPQKPHGPVGFGDSDLVCAS